MYSSRIHIFSVLYNRILAKLGLFNFYIFDHFNRYIFICVYNYKKIKKITYVSIPVFRIFSYSSVFFEIITSISAVVVLSALSYFILMLLVGSDFRYFLSFVSMAKSISYIFIALLISEISKTIILLLSDISFFLFHLENIDYYNYQINSMYLIFSISDTVFLLIGTIYFSLNLKSEFAQTAFSKLIPSILVIYIYFAIIQTINIKTCISFIIDKK